MNEIQRENVATKNVLAVKRNKFVEKIQRKMSSFICVFAVEKIRRVSLVKCLVNQTLIQKHGHKFGWQTGCFYVDTV